jgi:hypothetical protein
MQKLSPTGARSVADALQKVSLSGALFLLFVHRPYNCVSNGAGGLKRCHVGLIAQRALFAQARDYQDTARFYSNKAEQTYYEANSWASFDDFRRGRDQWDFFYSRDAGY